MSSYALPETVLLMTLDSLRYDTTQRARTPNFDRLLHDYTGRRAWARTHAHGTYTLPAHVSMFSGAKFPRDPDKRFPPVLTDAPSNPYDPSGTPYLSPLAPHLLRADSNIFEPFRQRGFHILGIGSVAWFDIRRATAHQIWPAYFDTFLYEDAFSENTVNSLEYQLAAMQPEYHATCCFLNVGSTHYPYNRTRAERPRITDCTIHDQIAALEYVDGLLWDILNRFARPTILYITGDHGECFGEDGQWGHSFYHRCVMEVPSLYTVLPVGAH